MRWWWSYKGHVNMPQAKKLFQLNTYFKKYFVKHLTEYFTNLTTNPFFAEKTFLSLNYIKELRIKDTLD